MIICISGGVGSGKTCMLTRYAKISYDLGKKLLCNYHLKKMEYKKLDLVDLYFNHPELNNIAIFGDELYTFMDCRASMSKRNRLESYLIAQTRKINCDLYFTVQFESFVDLRLMRFVDVFVEMENIWLLNKETGYKLPHPNKFIATFTDYRNPKNITHKTKIFNGIGYFEEYDTNERIYPPDDYIITKKELAKKRSKNKKK